MGEIALARHDLDSASREEAIAETFAPQKRTRFFSQRESPRRVAITRAATQALIHTANF